MDRGIERFLIQPDTYKEAITLIERFRRCDLIPHLHQNASIVSQVRVHMQRVAASVATSLYHCEKCGQGIDDELGDYLRFREGHPAAHLKRCPK
jgi:hypothetical protein